MSKHKYIYVFNTNLLLHIILMSFIVFVSLAACKYLADGHDGKAIFMWVSSVIGSFVIIKISEFIFKFIDKMRNKK